MLPDAEEEGIISGLSAWPGSMACTGKATTLFLHFLNEQAGVPEPARQRSFCGHSLSLGGRMLPEQPLCSLTHEQSEKPAKPSVQPNGRAGI